MQRLVFASANAGKAREIQAMLGQDVELLLQGELAIGSIEETGATFAENALIKARHAALESGLPAVADDSGLEVDFLGGAPGIHSARYAGNDASDQANLDKLLAELDGVPVAERGARFRCVLAFVRYGEDDEPIMVDASWEGRIAQHASGTGGFGYDPVFVDETAGCTSAQLTPAEKNSCSHRGKALQQLREELRRFGLLNAA
ncbi:MAG: RdgB/HAM1 family non-canonical purine NTP pyrophosphatase [Gammaproteobacteria bacterium]|nr:RdgB/HAM1 family non-canonical purine NTP pyrophosphatase [Gammaproteobacteria bacterium]MDP7093034.1 RdgB/HAM1 family non-canonical purine NTP pyrophosphatase [Gammaproteobacteria bacterium]MDP7270082.1 RdgB/HAM1 family non-canonical purine NTP pyrophosphatase [Gammaproteobacteria bacterium]HJP04163.1 RdgB/HAM1 family non-canonical purine NTP pyrophosphatase [Gammaproteobacteria bacterium]